VDSSDDAIISESLDGVVTSWNRGAERLFGYTAAEIVGGLITPLSAPGHDADVAAIPERVRRGERVDPYETRWRTKDGRVIDILLSVSPIRHRDGTLVGTSRIARDLTQRKQAEEELRRSELRFARFMQNLPGLAWIKDSRGRYVYANDAAERAFGLPRDRLYGRTDEETFPPGTAAVFREHDRRAVEAGSGIQVVETLEHPDGTVHHSLVSKFAIPNPGDVEALAGGMAIDITDRLEMEAALREADRRKDEFLAMLAHELRNPLSAIANASLVAGQAGTEEDRAWALDVIGRQVGNLGRMIDDLLDVTRITRGKIQLRREVVDVPTVLARAIEAVQPLIAQRGHALDVSQSSGDLRVDADPTRLEQVFTNLLANAAKYTDPGGHLDVAATRQGEEIVVTVRDDGIGIPAETMPHIFDLFAQADRTLDRSQGGLGIGLTLVQRLVALHGGVVSARSDGPGMGSEFLVRLPASEAKRHEARRAPAPDGRAQSRPRVLVVDDNIDSARGFERLLRAAGHEVLTAHDGRSALAVAREYRPEIVLLDIGLPGMNGYDVAAELRGMDGLEGLLIVAVTGYGQESDRARAQAAGFDAHLVKPVDMGALRTLLARRGRG
jgi:PAS domain S-box-containing protein